MSSSSKVLSIKPKINKKAASPVRGPFGQKYNPDGSIYQDYPRIGWRVHSCYDQKCQIPCSERACTSRSVQREAGSDTFR
jgi:hypothetical protein